MPNASPSACLTARCWSASSAARRAASPRRTDTLSSSFPVVTFRPAPCRGDGAYPQRMGMALRQSIELAKAERVGPEGVSASAFAEALKAAERALDWLRARHGAGTLPLLRLPEKHEDIAEIGRVAGGLAAATDVIFLGTGGSSLGGQTLAQLAGYAVPGVGALRDPPRLHFMDNLDPLSFELLLQRLPLATSRFVAISKSGGTGETLMQTAAVLAALRKAGLQSRIPEQVIGLSEPRKPGGHNGLRDLLAPSHAPVLDHDPGVGGRYSVFTNVGLLPAAVLGLDIGKLRQGAAASLAPVLEKRAAAEVPCAVGAALAVALARQGKRIAVLMAYADRLERFTRWYVQLWAESLGKDGKGTTPIGALGPVDQHSQLQLFIAGPRDKLFTIVTVGTAGRGPRIE